jgi:hypothetical protein
MFTVADGGTRPFPGAVRRVERLRRRRLVCPATSPPRSIIATAAAASLRDAKRNQFGQSATAPSCSIDVAYERTGRPCWRAYVLSTHPPDWCMFPNPTAAGPIDRRIQICRCFPFVAPMICSHSHMTAHVTVRGLLLFFTSLHFTWQQREAWIRPRCVALTHMFNAYTLLLRHIA